VGVVTAQLSRDERRRLLLESRPRFDDQSSGASLDDIDPARVRRFLETASRRGRVPDLSADLPLVEALRRLKVLRVVENHLEPTMAGVFLFAREPQRFVPQSVVGLARFPGTTRGTTQIVERMREGGKWKMERGKGKGKGKKGKGKGEDGCEAA
jgi:ATP-dependent DNA helicase RecG